MSFILRWLDLRRQRRPVGLRPHGEVTVSATCEDTATRVRRAVADVLGAHVTSDDGQTIEVAFGLVRSERLRCSLSSTEERQTRVRVEAVYPPGSPAPERSLSVDALLTALGRDERII
ncbi:MAG TPA: hypothetical protein VGF98_08095 [Candidatus Tumulicola sp.]